MIMNLATYKYSHNIHKMGIKYIQKLGFDTLYKCSFFKLECSNLGDI